MSKLVTEIKKRRLEAIKSQDRGIKSSLDVLLGEIQSLEFNKSQDGAVTDAQVMKIVRKIVKNNNESLAATQKKLDEYVANQNFEQASRLRGAITSLEVENKLLDSLLPQMWSQEKIKEELIGVVETITAAGSDGQATGVAVKHLKDLGADVDGKDVAAVVKQLRET